MPDSKWEVEQDKFRKTTNYVVDGFVEGYYYEDVSDPGVFVMYSYNPSTGNYVNVGFKDSEDKAKKFLQWLHEPFEWKGG